MHGSFPSEYTANTVYYIVVSILKETTVRLHLKRLAPAIYCNDIFLKVVLLLTCPKKYMSYMPRYGDIGVFHRKYIAEMAFSMY